MKPGFFLVALVILCLPLAALAAPPTQAEARQVIRAWLTDDSIRVDRVARGPNAFTNPTPADLKRDEAIREKWQKMDIFIGEINKETAGQYSVVYGVGNSTGTAWLLQGPKGWQMKCFLQANGAKRCV